VAGAGGGAVIGSLIGLTMRAQYDDDVARTIVVEAEPPAVLISTYTGPTSPNHAKVHNSRTGGCHCVSRWSQLCVRHAPV
jgi:hypothetical protein